MEKKTAVQLREHLSAFEPAYPIQKGYIARLLIGESSTIPDVLTKVKSIVHANEPGKLLHEGTLTTNLHVFKKLIIRKKCQLTKVWPSLITLFLEPFPVTFKTLPVTSALPQSGDTSPTQHPESTSTRPSNTLLQSDISQSAHSSVSVNVPSVSASGSSPKKLKRDCENCVRKQRTVMNMARQIKFMEKEMKCFCKKVQELPKAPPKRKTPRCSVKRLNETIKRQMQSTGLWHQKYRSLRVAHKDVVKKLSDQDVLRKTIDDLKASLDLNLKEKKQILAVNNQLTRMVADAGIKLQLQKDRHNEYKKTASMNTKKLKQLHAKEIREVKHSVGVTTAHFENEIAMLEEEVEENQVVQTRSKGQYNVMFRRCIYDFLLHNVSVWNVSHLLHSVGSILFNRTFSHLPCTSTVARMAIEIGILAEVQAGHILYNCQSATLAWDATTKGGTHINEVHVEVLTGEGTRYPLTLSISSISAGATEQVANHIAQSISDVCQAYSAAFDLNDAVVLEKVFNNIRATMSDRAKVNGSVHRELEKKMGRMVELKCSVHPLDGLAIAARKTLHHMDTTEGRCTTDVKPAIGCRAAQVLFQVSRLRYKDGTGDPSAFMAFLKHNNIDTSDIWRYVGNRLHVMFHMAAIVYHHRAILVDFMETRKKRALCRRILAGLKDPSIQIQLQVMGLFGKYVTGPWMRFFYDKRDGRTFLEGATEFQPCIERLKGILATPEELCNTTVDVLGNPMMYPQTDLRHLEMATRDEFLETVTKLADSFITVLTRQLGTRFHRPSSQMIADTASAPMHNMHAERTLGMMDALMRRAPHATIGFIDAKVKAVQNDTLHWLGSCPNNQQHELVEFAVRQAPMVRQRMAERRKAVQAAIYEKYEKSVRIAYEQELTSEVAKIGLDPLLLDLDMFRKLDVLSKERLKNFLRDNSTLSGVLLRHVWQLSGKHCVYYEMIWSVTPNRSKKNLSLRLWFWKLYDVQSDNSFSMNVKQFLVDFAMGDLTFV